MAAVPATLDLLGASFSACFGVLEGVPFDDRDELADGLLAAAPPQDHPLRWAAVLRMTLHVERRVVTSRDEPRAFGRGNRGSAAVLDTFNRHCTKDLMARALRPVFQRIAATPPLPGEYDTVPSSDVPAAAIPSVGQAGDDGSESEAAGLHTPPSNTSTTGLAPEPATLRHMSDTVDLLCTTLENSAAALWPWPLRRALAAFVADLSELPTSEPPTKVASFVDTALNAVLVLRTLSPLLTMPPPPEGGPEDGFGPAWTPPQRQRFMLFAKIVQRLANGTRFEQPAPSTGSEPSPLPSASLTGNVLLSLPEVLCCFNPLLVHFGVRFLAALRRVVATLPAPPPPAAAPAARPPPEAQFRLMSVLDRNARRVVQAMHAEMPRYPFHGERFLGVTGFWLRQHNALAAVSAGDTRHAAGAVLLPPSQGVETTPTSFAALLREGCALLAQLEDAGFRSPDSAASAAVRPGGAGGSAVLISEEALHAAQHLLLELTHNNSGTLQRRARAASQAKAYAVDQDYHGRPVVAVLAARLAVSLPVGEDSPVPLVFLSHTESGAGSWGLPWLLQLFANVFPPEFGAAISRVVVYKPPLMAKLLRLPSLSLLRRGHGLDRKVEDCSSLEQLLRLLNGCAALPASLLRDAPEAVEPPPLECEGRPSQSDVERVRPLLALLEWPVAVSAVAAALSAEGGGVKAVDEVAWRTEDLWLHKQNAFVSVGLLDNFGAVAASLLRILLQRTYTSRLGAFADADLQAILSSMREGLLSTTAASADVPPRPVAESAAESAAEPAEGVAEVTPVEPQGDGAEPAEAHEESGAPAEVPPEPAAGTPAAEAGGQEEGQEEGREEVVHASAAEAVATCMACPPLRLWGGDGVRESVVRHSWLKRRVVSTACRIARCMGGQPGGAAAAPSLVPLLFTTAAVEGPSAVCTPEEAAAVCEAVLCWEAEAAVAPVAPWVSLGQLGR